MVSAVHGTVHELPNALNTTLAAWKINKLNNEMYK
jgi:hypothetical protein